MDKITELSVFFPVYNEEENIASTVEKTQRVLRNLDLKSYEIILVDDGSKDKTPQVIKKLQEKDKYIRIVTHNSNEGYGAALKSGMYSAKYPWIVFTDSDGQFDFSEVSKFFEKQQETNADLVIGYYLKRAVPFNRKVNTALWQLIIRALFGLKVRDIDCAFKLFRKEVVAKIPKLESERGAFISSEFLIKAQKSGFKIAEVGVHHYSRKAGAATGASLKVIIKSFIDLFQLWQKLR